MRTLLVLALLSSSALAHGQLPPPAASLDVARELYATADYGAALDMLGHLSATTIATEERQTIDLYRTLCLVALGRRDAADQVIAAMVTRDPLYRPPDADIPPRLRPMFSDARRAMLPGVIQERYELARTTFERHEYQAAADRFNEVLMALSDPDVADAADRAPLAGLRLLTLGFKDLAQRAMTMEVTTPVPPPVVLQPTVSQQVAPQIVPEPAKPAAPKMPRIYDSNDRDVAVPVTIRQDLPRFQRPVPVERTGVLFIVIDEVGVVESAIITESMDRAYDSLVVAAAKTWRYQPALRSGEPVKYRKRIQVTLPRTN